MTTIKNNKENEVYILGSENAEQKHKPFYKKKTFFLSIFVILLILLSFFFLLHKEDTSTPEYYFEPEQTDSPSISVDLKDSTNGVASGCIEVAIDTINDVPLSLFIPHNATMSLTVGMPQKTDSTIIFAAMAADIRKDNNEIVGDFVLSGKLLSKGKAKKGFCAIIDHTITIGVGDETSLLQQSIDNKGYFFRQYPLVQNGELMENKPKNKSIRRAIGVRNDEVIMVESQQAESFHDFSQALIDIGISDAIYLVGGNAYGWYRNQENVFYEFGEELAEVPENVSYIVWQSK